MNDEKNRARHNAGNHVSFESLSESISRDNPHVLKTYLKNGGDPNIRDMLEGSLINVAIRKNRQWGVDLLIKHKVDINRSNMMSQTPLEIAIQYVSSVEMSESILKAGADPNAKSETGTSPMRVAIANGEVQQIELLIKYGAKIDVNFQDGGSPWKDIELNWYESFSYLIKLGVDPHLVDDQGRNALHWAALRGLDGIVEDLVKDHKMNPNTTDNNGDTPLHLGVGLGKTDVCDALLGLGADSNLINKEGYSAMGLLDPDAHFYPEDFQVLREMLTRARLKCLENVIDGGQQAINRSKTAARM